MTLLVIRMEERKEKLLGGFSPSLGGRKSKQEVKFRRQTCKRARYGVGGLWIALDKNAYPALPPRSSRTQRTAALVGAGGNCAQTRL